MSDPINDLIEAVYEWGNENTTKLADAANAENQALKERAATAEARVVELERVLDTLHKETTKGGSF